MEDIKNLPHFIKEVLDKHQIPHYMDLSAQENNIIIEFDSEKDCKEAEYYLRKENLTVKKLDDFLLVVFLKVGEQKEEILIADGIAEKRKALKEKYNLPEKPTEKKEPETTEEIKGAEETEGTEKEKPNKDNSKKGKLYFTGGAGSNGVEYSELKLIPQSDGTFKVVELVSISKHRMHEAEKENETEEDNTIRASRINAQLDFNFMDAITSNIEKALKEVYEKNSQSVRMVESPNGETILLFDIIGQTQFVANNIKGKKEVKIVNAVGKSIDEVKRIVREQIEEQGLENTTERTTSIQEINEKKRSYFTIEATNLFIDLKAEPEGEKLVVKFSNEKDKPEKKLDIDIGLVRGILDAQRNILNRKGDMETSPIDLAYDYLIENGYDSEKIKECLRKILSEDANDKMYRYNRSKKFTK